jgi:hypothetical protein
VRGMRFADCGGRPLVKPIGPRAEEEVSAICSRQFPRNDEALAEIAAFLHARYRRNQKILKRLKRRLFFIRMRQRTSKRFRLCKLRCRQAYLRTALWVLGRINATLG